MFKARSAIGIASCAIVLAASPPAQAMEPVPIKATKAWEERPAADEGYFGWTQLNRSLTRVSAYVEPTGAAPIRLNAGNRHGAMGAIDGTVAVFQQFSRFYSQWLETGRGNSDIKLYDLTARAVVNPPPGVNTKHWEFWPTLDGDWLLFGRIKPKASSVILRNIVTGESRILARVRIRRPRDLPDPGQVNGNFAVFDKCNAKRTRCNSFIHDIAANTTTMIPNPGAPWQWSPGVSSDGTVYFWRSGVTCRAALTLVRRDPSGTETILAEHPAGWYSDAIYVEDTDTVEVYYDAWNGCAKRADSDIYKVAG